MSITSLPAVRKSHKKLWIFAVSLLYFYTLQIYEVYCRQEDIMTIIVDWYLLFTHSQVGQLSQSNIYLDAGLQGTLNGVLNLTKTSKQALHGECRSLCWWRSIRERQLVGRRFRGQENLRSISNICSPMINRTLQSFESLMTAIFVWINSSWNKRISSSTQNAIFSVMTKKMPVSHQ